VAAAGSTEAASKPATASVVTCFTWVSCEWNFRATQVAHQVPNDLGLTPRFSPSRFF
jgi:hypothetical protein